MQEGEDDEYMYTLMVDGISVTSSPVFITAFSMFISVFYCFNMAYPSCLRKTLNFFQKVILNMEMLDRHFIHKWRESGS